ncbi:hypothetical protein MBLNU459_g2663t1 [Dothideomycetes sp. NU459]
MSNHDPSVRYTYTKPQLLQYFARISLPARHRESPILSNPSLARTIEHGLPLLAALQRYQLCAVPFENLELHYSSHHTISLDPGHLFHKIVERNAGRGGYCMENSCLLGTVLHSLGYDVVATGARVNEAVQPMAAKKDWPGPRYSGWNHMLNLVTMDGRTFFVDVGFGSSGPTRPVELKHNGSGSGSGSEGEGEQFANVPPEQSSRLVRTAIPDTVSKARSQALWVYEIRFTDDGAWTPAYCFGETEFLPADFNVMNHFTSTSRQSFFTYHVLCVKMLMAADKDTAGDAADGIIGDITLFDADLKRRIGGVSTSLATFTSDSERVEALKVHMGIELSQPEKDGIQDMMSKI